MCCVTSPRNDCHFQSHVTRNFFGGRRHHHKVWKKKKVDLFWIMHQTTTLLGVLSKRDWYISRSFLVQSKEVNWKISFRYDYRHKRKIFFRTDFSFTTAGSAPRVFFRRKMDSRFEFRLRGLGVLHEKYICRAGSVWKCCSDFVLKSPLNFEENWY